MHLVDLWFLALAERALDDAQCCFPSIVPKHFLEVAQLLQLFRLMASNAANYHILHFSKSMLQQISGSGTWDVMSF